ncbi:MAG: ribosomal protein L7/L12 [Clostridia bacterium]|nr:ribosomal protein L7/L12 [Clostridia bacterium]
MKKCPDCGTECEKAAKFCPNCAHSFEGHAASSLSTKYDVVLTDIGPNKIAVIKVVKERLNLGLADAKSKVEEVGILATGWTAGRANLFADKLREQGASVEIRVCGTATRVTPADDLSSVNNTFHRTTGSSVARTSSSSSGAVPAGKKKCPTCGRFISAAVSLCAFCKTSFNQPTTRSSSSSSSSSSSRSSTSRSSAPRYSYTPEKKTNGFAIAALLCLLFTGWLGPILGVILGSIAKKKGEEEMDGAGVTMSKWVVGISIVLLLLFGFAIMAEGCDALYYMI